MKTPALCLLLAATALPLPAAETPPPPGIHDPTLSGAVPNDAADDSAAFQTALDAIASAGKGVLRVPPGDFHFTNRVSVTLAGSAVAIVGAGQGVTRLIGDNPAGILALRDESCLWQVTIRDISFVAAREGAGTAVAVTSPPRGARNYRTLTMRDADIRGDCLPAVFHFDVAVDATGQWRPLFENVVASGPTGPGLARNRADDSPLYRMRCGFVADWCYAPTFEHCYAWSAHTGFRLASEGRPEGPEDASFRRCTANGVRIGIDVRTPINEPQLVVDACHINARDIGIRVERRKFFSLTDNLMYGLDTDESRLPYTDICLIDCYAGIVSRNIFQSPARHNTRPEPPVDHTMIRLDEKCRDIIVTDNIFNAKGTPVAIAQSATNILCRGNHASNPLAAPTP